MFKEKNIMKKEYINPETITVLMNTQTMIALSNPEGFDGNLDNGEEIEAGDLLSRRRHNDAWEDEEEEDY